MDEKLKAIPLDVMKVKVIPYDDINQKAAKQPATLSDQEALARALDLMDFYALLISQNHDLKLPVDDINWIELKYLPNDQQ